MKKNLIKAVSFLLVAGIIVGALNSILKFKYGESLRPAFSFYEQEEDSVDVLILGSSHAYTDIHPTVLWDNFGYSAYVLGASVQPLWNSYYYLEEALKTQKPKVIVLEGYRLVETSEYTSTYYAIKSTYGLKWSKTKINAMKASFDKENLSDYIFEFANYHARYSDLSKGDFVPYSNNPYYQNYKGELNKTEVYELKLPNVSEYGAIENDLAPKTEEYYIKILELAKEHNIPVMTVIAPYNMPKSDYGYYQSAKKIAAEYSMPFINTNEMYSELQIDASTDFSDKYGHLSSSGAEKLTKYIGQYINDHYDVSDHRGDDAYESWEIHSAQFQRYYYYDSFKDITDLSEYIEKYNRSTDYSLVMIVNASDVFTKDLSLSLQSLLTSEGANASDLQDGVYLFRNKELSFVSHDTELDKNLHFDSQTDIRVCCQTIDYTIKSFSKDPTFCMYVNNNDSLQAMPFGVTLLLYDEYLNRVVETVYCAADNSELTRENEYLESE